MKKICREDGWFNVKDGSNIDVLFDDGSKMEEGRREGGGRVGERWFYGGGTVVEGER